MNSLQESKYLFQRYQRGTVYKKGKTIQVWYGRYREEPVITDGRIVRRTRNIRLGTFSELPTKNAARERLTEMMRAPSTGGAMNFQELVDRWLVSEGKTLKPTTLIHYQNALRAYVLPTFGQWKIDTINREDIQLFLAKQAEKYSKSSLRSMRVVLGLTLGWATECGRLSKNPCTRVKLPKKTHGRKVARTALTAGQVDAITRKLEEPYATLVLLLAVSGLRIGEAIALKWSDFSTNSFRVTRRIYDGKVGDVKSDSSKRELPIGSVLLSRLKNLSDEGWVFQSRNGSPLNPGNVLKRYLRPVANELGIQLGGWHDLRHSLTTTMRRSGVHPKVISGVLGHSKVNLAMDVYDRATIDDFRQPLAQVQRDLLPSCYPEAV